MTDPAGPKRASGAGVVPQLRWDAARTDARVRPGGRISLAGWTGASRDAGPVDVFLVAQGTTYSLARIGAGGAGGGGSAHFCRSGVAVPGDVPPGTAVLVVIDPGNPMEIDSIPVAVMGLVTAAGPRPHATLSEPAG
ncbi:hypothetical protein ADL22_30535 [Streptomyces sp. NRRL F-4489]|uniref:hypothetical protein n=1 Tax=Streptomyces sp. NRRL F-4489 TaxID=1609095 RepID=UPI000746B470|nr:hypothetical protein [Streptomyces sp. NRRL F-4489]KUL34386.1 hypothetical protein ADL22_30535 [Streptomyces sp. NRRL F-4489]